MLRGQPAVCRGAHRRKRGGGGGAGRTARHAGVRFYFPGELGTVVPTAPSVKLQEGSYSVTPRFARRDCYLHGAGPYPGIDPDDTKAQRRAGTAWFDGVRLDEKSQPGADGSEQVTFQQLCPTP